ncbi:MAG: hypothetical protein GWN67_28850 [Phycisphaerae bacterium]|nr:hypothetical protein [Phycisphaerae bacterium]NIW11937.1 hypothetical protein [Gammaproteobacteria bacterium]NIW96536.1 hypothetical protein [Phycisphaerae bacterium]
MVQIKSGSDSFIARFNRWLDRWLQDRLPAWLYKQMTLQPDRALKPDNSRVALGFDLLLIAIAIILLILSLK